MKTLQARPLSADEFSPFGDVIETAGAENFKINNGRCTRFHDLASIETLGPGARPMISIARGEPYELPLKLPMVERHPLGSQAFIPLSQKPFLVIVCEDLDGVPGTPKVFRSTGGQGVNYHHNVWHGVLTPLDKVSEFIIVDRGGEGNNLEEYFFDEPYLIEG